jgi:hypothetical protein
MIPAEAERDRLKNVEIPKAERELKEQNELMSSYESKAKQVFRASYSLFMYNIQIDRILV